MFRILKGLVYFAVLAVIALSAYAYLGPMEPARVQVVQPVSLAVAPTEPAVTILSSSPATSGGTTNDAP